MPRCAELWDGVAKRWQSIINPGDCLFGVQVHPALGLGKGDACIEQSVETACSVSRFTELWGGVAGRWLNITGYGVSLFSVQMHPALE